MGTNLQMFVLGAMAANRVGVSELQRMTGISRRTLTEITKGRYTQGSERTRETLERLADGLRVARADVLEAAGLSALPPPRSVTLPADILSKVLETQRQLAEEIERLVEALRAGGHQVPPAPERDAPSGEPGS